MPVMNKTIQILDLATQIMTSAGVAVPVVFGAVMAINGIIKAVTGDGASLTELTAVLKGKLDRNDTQLDAEIARLQAKIDAASNPTT